MGPSEPLERRMLLERDLAIGGVSVCPLPLAACPSVRYRW